VSGGSTVPLKHLATINERALPEDSDPSFSFRYVDIGTVGHGDLVAEPQEMSFGEAPSRARRLVRSGDTIVSTVRTYLRAVWPVPDDVDDLVVSTGFAVLTPQRIDPRYFSWWVRSDIFVEDVVARSVGVSYPAINALDLGRLPVRVPPVAEQRAIAEFLDAETARIDALRAKKRRMIRLLEERRHSASIAGVGGELLVTPSRSSTLAWLPEIPRHWDDVMLKLVASVGSGHTPSRDKPEWWIDCVVPWVTTGEVAQMRSDRIEYLRETREKLSHLGIANSSATVHPAGTVVLPGHRDVDLRTTSTPAIPASLPSGHAHGSARSSGDGVDTQDDLHAGPVSAANPAPTR
jgi:type I restriction enzyme S subunit